MERVPINLIVVLGPTASGKTKLSVTLARLIDGEIISADSRQVFRGMDIGTGKELSEYDGIRHHLIDIRDPSEEFTLFHFQRECIKGWEDILSRGKVPLLVGGTGLYIESVLNGYRLVETPENSELRAETAELPIDKLLVRLSAVTTLHNTTDTLDRERLIRAIEIAEYAKDHNPEPLPEIRSLIFGLHWERETLRKRITVRLKERMACGMVEEVQQLRDSGISWERLDYFGLEYRFIARYLRGGINRNDMVQKLNSAINDLAKRQGNWFRRMERNGTAIHWLDGADDPLGQAMAILEKYLSVSHD